ncbi:MAG: WHG domain-containing protein [Oscillospiraceae bacterium]|jgi:AcrR family transcriptional regulator|nr:WHG domain-containing protein [Oscillospiraceae bacterium]
MSTKRNLNQSAIIAAATVITERGGLDTLTVNALAAELGIKPPSLYNHFKGADELKRLLAESVLSRIGDAVKTAAVGRSDEIALREVAAAYRRFAGEKPELYRVFLSAPALSADALGAVGDTLIQVLAALDETDRLHFTRFFHAALHGFMSLENTGFFQSAEPSANESFAAMVDMLINNYKILRGN